MTNITTILIALAIFIFIVVFIGSMIAIPKDENLQKNFKPTIRDTIHISLIVSTYVSLVVFITTVVIVGFYDALSQNETKIIEHGKTVTIIPSEIDVDYIPSENPLYAELIFKGDNDESTPPEIIELESMQLYVDGKRTHKFPDVNNKAIASLKLSKIIKWTNTNLFYSKEEEPKSQYLIQIDLKKDENVRKARQ